MCAPAAAALVLAALTALPCQGIDADTAARIRSANRNVNLTEHSPTVNKAYQMLHTTPLAPATRLLNTSNLSVNLNNIPTSFGNLISDCCHAKVDNDNVKLPDGAKVVLSLDKKRKAIRRHAVVKLAKVDSSGRDIRNSSEVTVPVNSVSLVRRKSGETGSSAPLLNYIYDTSNAHQHTHKNDRAGNGNSIYAAAAPEVKALVGSTALLDCKVDALHDKLVSWVRRKNDEQETMELLTTGTQLYTSDNRYSARFIPPDIWRLEIRDVRSADAASYDCQLSAHPPRTARVTLHVPEVSVRIVDGAGAAVSEQVCEEGSTVALRCEVRGLKMEGGPALLWYRREDLLNDDTTRGGISVRTEFGLNGANSVLRVARVRPADAGRYACTVAHSPPIALPPAHVLLHVIKGESLAELHQGSAALAPHTPACLLAVTLTALRGILVV